MPQLRHYSALSAFAHTLLQNDVIELPILMRLALRMVLEFVEATEGRLLLLGPGGRIQEHYALPEPEEPLELQPHCLEALKTLQPVIWGPHASGSGALCVPLVGKSDPFGVLCLRRSVELHPFDRDDLELVSAFADQLTSSIYTERLLREKYESEHLAALGRMASRIVHDMNNPLGVIQGYTELLLAKEFEASRRQEFLQRIAQQSKLLRQMLQDVLAYAGSRQRRPWNRVELTSLLGEMIQGWFAHQETARVQLHFQPVDACTVQGDGLALNRAFRNLIQNAVEAAPEGSEVHVKLGLEKEYGIIEIRDAGPGIPPEIQHQLFQPFVTHGKPQGTGLGLATAKNILEEHGGSLSFQTSPQGTVFHALLPCV